MANYFVASIYVFYHNSLHSCNFPAKIRHIGDHFHREHMYIYFLYCMLGNFCTKLLYINFIVLDFHFFLREEICTMVLACIYHDFKSRSRPVIFLLNLNLHQILTFHEKIYNLHQICITLLRINCTIFFFNLVKTSIKELLIKC